MDILSSVFGFYDKIVGALPLSYQGIISFSLLLFFVFIVYIFFKSKNWIFLAVIVLLLPSTWPAAKKIGVIVWTLFKGLFERLKGI